MEWRRTRTTSLLATALHNEGKIDLVSLPNQAAFAGIAGREFFIAQHLYCEAIPKLKTDAMALMQCCQNLVEHAGADLAAGAPNGAFLSSCQNNPKERAKVIEDARAGGDLVARVTRTEGTALRA